MHHSSHHSYTGDDTFLLEIRAGGLVAETAIAMLYTRYRRRVYHSIRRIIARHHNYRGTPEDLVHDSFILMIQKIQFENLTVRSLHGFWLGIANNLFLNQLKKDERIVGVYESEEKYGLNEDTPEVLYLALEKEEQMAKTFSLLGPRCREVLMLWIDRYSMPEIAGLMNLSTAAMARKIKYSCFKKLKELIKAGYKMPG